jgi:hypothetical protein
MAIDTKEFTEATCAGRPIRASMYPFSNDLIKGCQQFAALANDAEDDFSVRLFNTSCIFSGASSIEAQVNEWLSILREIEDAGIPTAFWSELAISAKSLSLVQKWNFIAALRGGTLWDSGREPFQSYEIVVTLRNELIHYKGQFLGKDETPARKLSGLMKQLGIKSEATFIGDDSSSWAFDLLNHRQLGVWVHSKIRPFYDDVITLLIEYSSAKN